MLAVLYRKLKSSGLDLPPQPEKTSQLPHVLIQLPIYNEKPVVERLLRATASINYPRHLLSIQLLDDSNDETSAIAAQVIASIAASGGPGITHVRRPSREGYKAGALAYGLAQDQSDLVVIFDADFLPQPDFLAKLVPYFENPKVGLVQTRWDYVNRDYSILTRLMAFAIDNHFSVEQGGRQNMDCFVNFNGTAGMWRRKAIDDAGGWSDDCLTEDLDLSFRAQLRGWEFLFIEDIATPSELPITMQAIRDQQVRWTKGAAETGRKNLGLLWRSGERLRRKIIGTFHLFNSSVFLPLLILGVVTAALPMLPGSPDPVAALLVHVAMAISLVMIIFTYWVSRRYGGFDWLNSSSSEILRTALFFIVMTLGFTLSNGWAALRGLIGWQTAFKRTPKFNVQSGDGHRATAFVRARRLPLEVYFELALVGYFALSLYVSAHTRHYEYADVTAIFMLGYVLMLFFTLRDRFTLARAVIQPAKGPATSR